MSLPLSFSEQQRESGNIYSKNNDAEQVPRKI